MNGIKLMCAVCLSVFFGCKAGPGKTTEFFGDTNGMVQDPTVETFHKVWVRDDVDWYKFKKIFIAPVNTQHLRKMSWWGKITIEQFSQFVVSLLMEHVQE